MDDILLALLKRRAHLKPVKITTSHLGYETGMSQQNASRKIAILEKMGYLERKKEGLKLTAKAYEELASMYSELRAVFEGGHIDIDGTIVKGLGEGGYYVSMDGYRRQIKDKFGFEPFPGTLNVKLDEEEIWKRQALFQMEPITIKGFRDKDRTFGDLFAFKCRVEDRECVLIIPIRTHHGPDIIEILSPINIKREFGKKDGDRITVVI